MVIHSAIVTALVVLFSVIAFGDTLPGDARKRAAALWATVDSYETNAPATMTKVRKLTEEERALVRTYYQEEFEYYNRRDPNGGDQFLVRLAMLGDPEARDRIVRKWVNSGGTERLWDYPHDLLRIESPEAIAQIGELLFLNEKDQMPTDVGFIAPQTSAFVVVENTLQKSPAFSDAVRGWANQVYKLRNGMGWTFTDALEVMRAWYRANEALLKRGEFAAVQPGRSPPSEHASASAGTPTAVTRSASPDVLANPVIQLASEPASTRSAWSFGAIAAVCVAILGGLLFFWKRRA